MPLPRALPLSLVFKTAPPGRAGRERFESVRHLGAESRCRPKLPLVATGWTALCRFALVLGFALGTALAQPGASGQARKPETRELRHARLYAVASNRMFNTVNRNDAVAAIKAWFDIVGREKGFLLDSKVEILDSVAEMRRRLQSGSVEILILDFADYLQLEGSGLIVPNMVGLRKVGAEPLYSYFLMVNPSSTAKTIADLRGKRILVFSRTASNAGIVWLDMLLGKQKLGSAASFFASIKETGKPQACILPLFFGSIDACVVDEINLDLLKEMNPQLGNLRPLARSSPLIESVIATPSEQHPYRDDLFDIILSLHQDPRGRQLLMVFKTEQIVRIRPGVLEAAGEFWREYNRLTSSPPRLPAGAAPVSSPPTVRTQPDRGREKD